PAARESVVSFTAPAGTGAAEWLAARVATRLGVAPGSIALDQPLARHGLDSLRSMELAHEIEQTFGVVLGAADLLSAASIAEIAERIARPGSRCAEPPEPAAGAPA